MTNLGTPRRTRTKMLAAYDRLQAATAHKRSLVPERLKTLQTDPEFTRAVSDERAAHDSLVAAALAHCRALKDRP